LGVTVQEAEDTQTLTLGSSNIILFAKKEEKKSFFFKKEMLYVFLLCSSVSTIMWLLKVFVRGNKI